MGAFRRSGRSILFAAGRDEAISLFLVDDGIGKDARFWKLAQSLSALYPSGTDENRWVDGGEEETRIMISLLPDIPHG